MHFIEKIIQGIQAQDYHHFLHIRITSETSQYTRKRKRNLKSTFPDTVGLIAKMLKMVSGCFTNSDLLLSNKALKSEEPVEVSETGQKLLKQC